MRRIFTPELMQTNLFKNYTVIKGAAALASGESNDLTRLGVRAVDNFTFEVELETPVGYLLQLFASTNAFPVPRHIIEKFGAAWTEPDKIVTNGPFKLAEFEPGKLIRLEKYETYHGTFDGNLDKIDID
ncbi:MAG: ABC transporter substrate-binding protein, partial [Chloroflexota bacterium]